MKTICVTGINGYLGSATARKFIDLGCKVVGLGTSSDSSSSLSEEVIYEVADIRDTDRLAEIFEKYQIEVVYHFAAIKYVGLCEKDPDTCLSVNTEGTRSVVEAMGRVKVPKIIYASTYAVYEWKGDVVNLSEESPTNPKTVYGQSKLKAEEVIKKAYQDKTISEYQILRYGNIIGNTEEAPLRTVQSFIDKLVVASKNDESVTLSGNTFATEDGTAARDFIDVRDVVSANILALASQESGVYNISSGSNTTLEQIINILEDLSGKPIEHSYAERSPEEPSVINIQNQKAVSSLKWKPQYSTQDTIKYLFNTALY